MYFAPVSVAAPLAVVVRLVLDFAAFVAVVVTVSAPIEPCNFS